MTGVLHEKLSIMNGYCTQRKRNMNKLDTRCSLELPRNKPTVVNIPADVIESLGLSTPTKNSPSSPSFLSRSPKFEVSFVEFIEEHESEYSQSPNKH
jgi:hypothetical protein